MATVSCASSEHASSTPMRGLLHLHQRRMIGPALASASWIPAVSGRHPHYTALCSAGHDGYCIRLGCRAIIRTFGGHSGGGTGDLLEGPWKGLAWGRLWVGPACPQPVIASVRGGGGPENSDSGIDSWVVKKGTRTRWTCSLRKGCRVLSPDGVRRPREIQRVVVHQHLLWPERSS